VVNGKCGAGKRFGSNYGCDRGDAGGKLQSMSSIRLVHRAILLVAVLGLAGMVSASLPERKTFQFGEFTIEASAGDEAYVEALAVKLADYQLPKAETQPTLKLGLDDLEKRRDYFLGKVSMYLGLDKPTEKMASTYDTMGTLWRTMRLVAPKGMLRHYALWRKPELVARIQAGEKIPGFTLARSGDLDFNFEFKLNSNSGDLQPEPVAARTAAFWNSFICPIKIGATPDTTPAEEVSNQLDGLIRNILGFLGQQMQVTERQIVFNVLHETTESGVVWHYLTSKDRRWFCDGVANYVAWKVIEREIGAEEVKGYYDLTAELKKYENEASRVDLASWPAAENMEQARYAEDLNTANYAFATKVIADACAKQGDGVLPQLFVEIGRTKRERATMETVFKAYRRLTGENLRSYLPKPAAPAGKSGG